MKMVRVIKVNKRDRNPWLPSDKPFMILDEYGKGEDATLWIYPEGGSEDDAHHIPKNHTTPWVQSDKENK